jgi:hypothetical protein
MPELKDVKVTDLAGAVLLNNGFGTLVKTRVTVRGGWTANPQTGQNYRIQSSNRSLLDGRCAGIDSGEATFNLV